MPLPPSAPRRLIHTRRVECLGYIRHDGLWDIEGRMTDVKTYAFDSRHRGRVQVGEPLHDMTLRLTLDDGLTICDALATTDGAPWRICGDIAPAYRALVGLRIAPGFTAQARVRMGGVKGCTHLTELLGPMATTAIQTVYGSGERAKALIGRPKAKPASQPEKAPHHLDSCHALDRRGPVVREVWPEAWIGEQAVQGD